MGLAFKSTVLHTPGNYHHMHHFDDGAFDLPADFVRETENLYEIVKI